MPDKLLTFADLKRLGITCTQTHLMRLVADGSFPKPLQIADTEPPTTATMAERDSAVEALCLHVKESVRAFDHYDLDNAGHG